MGRAIPNPGFAGDDGSADPRLAAALTGHAEGRVGEPELLAALAAARLLVPVVAVLAEAQDPPEPGAAGAAGLRREKSTDMAVVTLRAPDGRGALPAFSCLDTLAGWNPQARPVPVGARLACQAALAEGAGSLLVDLGTDACFELSGPALRALAEGRTPLPPLDDPLVEAAVRAAVGSEPAFAGVRLLPAENGDVRIGLLPAAGASAERVREGAGRVASRLAGDPVIRDRIGRGLELAVLPV